MKLFLHLLKIFMDGKFKKVKGKLVTFNDSI